MTIKLHIERLVLDPKLLVPAQVPRFRAALTEALGRLYAPTGEPASRPRDAVGRLAERTARQIHQQAARR